MCLFMGFISLSYIKNLWFFMCESWVNKIKENKIHPNEVTILCSRISVLKEIDFIIRKKFNEKTTRTFESKELYERGTNKYDILKSLNKEPIV